MTQLLAGSNDLSSQIQTLFGTTRLAPYGSLSATICQASVTPGNQDITVAGASETGPTVRASAPVSYAGASSNPAAFSASASTINLSGSNPAALDLSFGGAEAQWTASVLPSNRTSTWLSVTPPSGSGAASLTIRANLDGLNPGVYRAAVAIEAQDAVPQFIGVPVVLTVGAVQGMTIGGVSNNASFTPALAPGMQAAVFGSNLAASGRSATMVPLPLKLNGVTATVNGVAAPLYFVSPGQVNIQIPYETGTGTAALAINNNGQAASFQMPISMVAPGIYPVVINATSNAYNTATPGDVIEIFLTGDGDLTPTLATGATPAATTAANRLPKPRQSVSVTVAGIPAGVAFVGVPNGLAGVTQVNLTVPAGVPAGSQPIVVTMGGVSSAPMNLTIFGR